MYSYKVHLVSQNLLSIHKFEEVMIYNYIVLKYSYGHNYRYINKKYYYDPIRHGLRHIAEP